ncbi:DUF1289 domain-containing protein [Brevundimonas sp.]|uniref:DUF1289 domain-containing protein n=1 Tax=Brevundimonas sp. TaxID=1871086 RepID=UPI00391976C1
MSDVNTPNSSRPPSGPPRSIPTPCVQVCAVDGETGFCLGCFRTLSEISGWSRYSDAERSAIMSDLQDRRSQITPALLHPKSP